MRIVNLLWTRSIELVAVSLGLIHKATSNTLKKLERQATNYLPLTKSRLVALQVPQIHFADANSQLHPLCQQKPIVKYCNDNGIVVQAYCPIIRGQWKEEPVIQEVAKKVSIFWYRSIYETIYWCW